MSKGIGLALIGLLAVGCGQSYEEAMRLLCESPDKSNAADHVPDRRMQVLSEWVDEHVEHGKVRALFVSLGEMAPEQRSETLATAAKEAGVATCRLAIVLAPVEPDRESAAPGGP